MVAPYTIEPVVWPGLPLRLTYRVVGELEAMQAVIDGKTWPFTVAGDAAELVIPEEDAAQIPDRSRVEIRVRTRGLWHLLCAGHITRRVP